MVVSAVATLVFLAALAAGINDAMVRNSVGLYSGHIRAEGLPADLDPARLKISGVTAVLIRIETPAWLRFGDRIRTVQLVAVDPAAERAHTALPKLTGTGRYLQPDEAGIYLGEAIRDDLGAAPGDSVEFGVRPGTPEGNLPLRGSFRTGIPALDGGLAFRPMTDSDGSGPRSAAIFLAGGADPAETARRLGEFPGTYTPWPEFMPDLKQLIDLNFVSMGIVMVLVFGIVSLGIACAFIIFVLKNLREYGVLKAMGMCASETAALLLAQVGLLNLASVAAGTGLGVAAVFAVARVGIDLTAFTSHNPYFTVSGVIYPRLTRFSLLTPPALALVFGMASAVWPTIYVVRKRAAAILRSL
jgi:ABC-type lipoprotein release transport system permease subunit